MSFWTLVVLAIGFVTATVFWAVLYLQEGKGQVYINVRKGVFFIQIGGGDGPERGSKADG